MKSKVAEEREAAINLCTFLLHHIPKLETVDLVGHDLISRDILNKHSNEKFWQALNIVDK